VVALSLPRQLEPLDGRRTRTEHAFIGERRLERDLVLADIAEPICDCVLFIDGPTGRYRVGKSEDEDAF